LAANSEVMSLIHPSLSALVVAGTGALAGVVTIAAFQRSFQAGPLIGAGLAVEGLERFGADWGFIVGLGVPFLWLKQRFLHQRKPLV
jgi:hypothetical protein